MRRVARFGTFLSVVGTTLARPWHRGWKLSDAGTQTDPEWSEPVCGLGLVGQLVTDPGNSWAAVVTGVAVW